MLRAEFYYSESSKMPDYVNYPEVPGFLMRDGERPMKCITTGNASGVGPRGLGKWTRALKNALRPGGDIVLNKEVTLALCEDMEADLNVGGPSSESRIVECPPSTKYPFGECEESELADAKYQARPLSYLGDTHEAQTFGPRPTEKVLTDKELSDLAELNSLAIKAGPLSNDPLENPKKAAGAVKAPFHATPELGLIQMENVMAGGGYKYGDFNYHDSKVDAKTYMSAIRRHMLLWKDGVDLDDESQQNHLAHVMACCAIMIEAQGTGMFIDNRPKTGLVAEALRKSSSTFEAYRAEYDRKTSSPENASS